MLTGRPVGERLDALGGLDHPPHRRSLGPYSVCSPSEGSLQSKRHCRQVSIVSSAESVGFSKRPVVDPDFDALDTAMLGPRHAGD